MEINTLNYNDLSFFAGITTSQAKNYIASVLYNDEEIETTKTGVAKIKMSEVIKSDQYDFTIKSNSRLEGVSQLEYLTDHYSKGTTISKLFSFSENKSYIKKISFTGNHSILNKILNKDQLFKLKKTWLIKNLDTNRCFRLNKTSYNFLIRNNDILQYAKKERPEYNLDLKIEEFKESLK